MSPIYRSLEYNNQQKFLIIYGKHILEHFSMDECEYGLMISAFYMQVLLT